MFPFTVMGTATSNESRSSTLKRSLKPGFLAVLDQCLFCGINFFTALLVGRIAGPSELGVYTLCFSFAMISIATQRALLVSPFVIVATTLNSTELREMRGSMLTATILFAGLLALLSTFAFTVVSPFVALALMAILPASLFRDFHRRLSIAQLELKSAFWFDFVIAACQFAGLGYATWAGKLSATSALFICSFVWTATFLITLIITRECYQFGWLHFRRNLTMLWPIGRWVGLSQLVSTTQAFALPWVLAAAGSLELAGIYAACWTIVQVTSPIIEGLGNLLGPALARSAKGKSLDAMKERAEMATVVFSTLMIGLIVVVALFGQQILFGLFGDLYSNAFPVLMLLTLASAVLNVGIPATKALTQLGKANWNFWIAAISLLITLIVAASCLKLLGPAGAAWGLLAGALMSTCVRCFLFRRLWMHLKSDQEINAVFSHADNPSEETVL